MDQNGGKRINFKLKKNKIDSDVDYSENGSNVLRSFGRYLWDRTLTIKKILLRID